MLELGIGLGLGVRVLGFRVMSCPSVSCIQDTLSSRAALGLPAA